MKSLLVPALVAALVVLNAASCNDDPPFFGFYCESDADCASGNSCIANTCRFPEADAASGDASSDAAESDAGDTGVEGTGTADTTPDVAEDTATDLGPDTPDTQPDVVVRRDTGPDVDECVPDCGGRACGGDGCGGLCGSCGGDAFCSDDFECIAYLNCIELNQCVVDCGRNESCLNECQSNAKPQAVNLLIAALQCVEDNCSDALTQEEFDACQREFCADQINACVAN